ncbi:PAS domain-containing response regulator [Halogeometricum borinquense]|uniref:PAS domain-containing response regulator n=1 Tax=Halogeometricum borinquense TaxID=60847 RepID=UPI00342A0C08
MNGDGVGTSGVASPRTLDEKRQIQVLHVDDDPAFGDLTVARLERERSDGPAIRVESLADPTEALNQLEGTDCVVSDFEMPEMDGLELLDAVRERRPNLPFVLFTGKGSEQIASRAISAGVTDYLRKGGSSDRFDVLANRIRNAVARYRAEQEVEQSETRLRRIIDLLPQCIFLKDRSGQYLLMNRSGADTYGMKPTEIEGYHESELHSSEAAEKFRKEDLKILESGEPAYVPEQRRRTDDGSLVVERVQKVPFELNARGAKGVLGVVDDITAEFFREKRRKAALNEIEVIESALADARTASGESVSDAHNRCATSLERIRALLSNDGPLDDADAESDSPADSESDTTGE